MITEEDLLQNIIDKVGTSGTAANGVNYNRLINSLVNGRWNGDLLAQAGTHQGKIHSWTAGVVVSGQKRQTHRMNHYWGVRLRGYLFHWDNGDTDNSHKYIAAEIKQIKRYFAERKDLELDQAATGFLKHDEIQETNRAVQHAGNGSCHVINLFLGCHLYEALPN